MITGCSKPFNGSTNQTENESYPPLEQPSSLCTPANTSTAFKGFLKLTFIGSTDSSTSSVQTLSALKLTFFTVYFLKCRNLLLVLVLGWAWMRWVFPTSVLRVLQTTISNFILKLQNVHDSSDCGFKSQVKGRFEGLSSDFQS